MDSQDHLCRKLSKVPPNPEFLTQPGVVRAHVEHFERGQTDQMPCFASFPGASQRVAGQISNSAQTPHEPVFVDLSYLIMFQ